MARLANYTDTASRGGESFVPTPYQPQWSPQSVARYFAWVGTNPHRQQDYFSLQVGVAIVRFLEFAGVLRGKVIDYGCGPGYLSRLLIEKPIELHSADFSAEAVQAVNQHLASRSNYGGGVLIRSLPCEKLAENSFDLAICLETIEHLSSEQLESTLAELSRIVKPGGYVFLTTPNSENLQKSMTYCPFCEAEYHAWQHVRSFTPPLLAKLLAERGWQIKFCDGLNLWRFMPRPWPGKWDFNLRYAMGSWHRISATVRDRFFPRPFPDGRLFRVLRQPGPHLVALARKG